MPCKARLRNKEPEIQDPGGEGTASFAGIIACGGSCRARGAAAVLGAGGGAAAAPPPPKNPPGGGRGGARPPPPRAGGAAPPAAAPLGAHGDQEGRDGRRKSNGKKGGKARAL